jgi:glycosyltransferase involved in cell wall biosynthesis
VAEHDPTTGADQVGVSVVIATYRRPALLDAQLRAVRAQRAEFPFEVVVVDDASADPATTAVLDRHMAEDRRVRVLARDRNGGPAQARNSGVTTATGAVVAFTDDDCIVQAGWLQALATPILMGDADMTQGRTVAEPPERRDRWTHAINVSGPNRFETCNIAYSAALLRSLGGFDGSFRNAEDADLGNRALARGARFLFLPGAMVEHVRIPLDLATLLRRRSLASALARVARRHPAFRDQLWRGVLWRRGHLRVLAALAATTAAALARRPVTAGFIVLLWTAREAAAFPDAGPIRRAGLGAGIVAADIVEVGATACGALRERTLVL